jgi:hypothetical protein
LVRPLIAILISLFASAALMQAGTIIIDDFTTPTQRTGVCNGPNCSPTPSAIQIQGTNIIGPSRFLSLNSSVATTTVLAYLQNGSLFLTSSPPTRPVLDMGWALWEATTFDPELYFAFDALSGSAPGQDTLGSWAVTFRNANGQLRSTSQSIPGSFVSNQTYRVALSQLVGDPAILNSVTDILFQIAGSTGADFRLDNFRLETAPVPEPSVNWLIGSGLGIVAALRLRGRR